MKQNKNELTKEDVENILKAIQEALALHGQEVETAILYEVDQEPEILVDNRDKDLLN